MTHQRFIEEAIRHYVVSEAVYYGTPEFIDISDVFVVWSCKTADNSKVILADKFSDVLCEATLIGSKNIICYDFYRKTAHEESEIK